MKKDNCKITITSHALERAKQRLKFLNYDHNNSLLFEYQVKDIFKKSIIDYYDNENINYATNVKNEKIIFKTKKINNEIIIITIITSKIKK